jgi:cytochrome P450
MLAMHSEVQKKVIDELDSIFGSSELDINNDNINRLNFLDVVIKETMRLFPLAPVIGRNMTDDLKLDGKFNLFYYFF